MIKVCEEVQRKKECDGEFGIPLELAWEISIGHVFLGSLDVQTARLRYQITLVKEKTISLSYYNTLPYKRKCHGSLGLTLQYFQYILEDHLSIYMLNILHFLNFENMLEAHLAICWRIILLQSTRHAHFSQLPCCHYFCIFHPFILRKVDFLLYKDSILLGRRYGKSFWYLGFLKLIK